MKARAIPRVLVGIGDIAGYGSGLKTGFDEIGIPCDFLELALHRFKYRDSAGFLPFQEFVWRMSGRIRVSSKTGCRSGLVFWSAARALATLPLFWACLLRYDIFIFLGRSSFFKLLELPVLKLLGKKIVFIFLGSDIRPAYLNGRYFHDGQNRSLNWIIAETLRQARDVRWIEKWSHTIVAHPPTAHLLRKPFVPFLYLGIPTAIPAGDYNRKLSDGMIKILHGPSAPESKGSPEIRDACRVFIEEGYPLRLVELSGVSHDKMLEAILECDFVVDQVYSDTPLAGFAAEAAVRGRPAVIGGYFNTEDLGVPPSMIPPSMHVLPEDIKIGIEELVSDPRKRQQLSEDSRQFVVSHWSPGKVAKRLYDILCKPAELFPISRPENIAYIDGYGQKRTDLTERLVKIYNLYGISSFCLPRNFKSLDAIKSIIRSTHCSDVS